MEKKEFKIGEEFQFGFKRLKCVENNGKLSDGCVFETLDDCCGLVCFTGGCSRQERIDKTDVIFIDVKDETI